MKLALVISVLLQLLAAIVALRLTRQTKYSISWVLISVAFLLMALRRILDLLPYYYGDLQDLLLIIDRAMGIVISILLVAGVLFVQKLFSFMKRIDNIRRESEHRVLQAVMETEEKERRQFARDLHDGIGPLLSNVKMSISALDQSRIDGFNKIVIDNINSMISESITALKNTSNNLSPHILDSFGLVSAINTFIENITTLGTYDITFNQNVEASRFDENVEINIYRVVCELFHNSLKHADASNISLLIHYHDGRLVVQYFDDGRGFDPESADTMSGMGISNMKSRLRTLRGDIEFKRIEPRGMMTSITLKAKPKAVSHGKD